MIWKLTNKATGSITIGTLEACLCDYADIMHLDYEQEILPGSLLHLTKTMLQRKMVLEDDYARIEALADA